MKTTIKYLIFLISITVNAQLEKQEKTCSYDNLNRLVKVVFNGKTEKKYVYDDLGNRIALNIKTLHIDTETLKNTITVYPNPTDSFLNVKLPESIIDNKTIIKLYDVNGRLIHNHQTTIKDNSANINVEELSSGVYLLHLVNGSTKYSKLFIKK
ncbi:conserved protein of unknown function precursor containing a T9SS type A C-terminal secretion signal [Tenacibaculum sp. 190524A02b]|uniref:T9SS type A sorting domain-containing protein n=1 Tax=Tenacibaculum vairaonense TaxID=3137860 RepID=UPI0032B2F753